jgi:hypothetical protein
MRGWSSGSETPCSGHANFSLNHAREAVGAQLVEHVAELALAVAHDRRVDGELRRLRQREDLLDDLIEALAGDRPPADRAVRAPDAGVEQAQVVVDLRDRADGRTRVARRRLLVDRDRRREPVDRVDVGLLHHLQELACVRGEALDVAPLALRVDRVEGERGLAGARETGDADERVPRQADIDVLEVVLARPVDDQLVGSHNRSILASEHMFVQGKRGTGPRALAAGAHSAVCPSADGLR